MGAEVVSVGGWYPGEGEVYLGATLSNPRAADIVPAECGQAEPASEEEVRQAKAAREWRRAHGCLTLHDRMMEELIEGFRNPPKLRRRKFGPWTPIR